jgi:hypothetical protein
MDKAVAAVLNGYLALDTARRTAFVTEINKYINGQSQEEALKKSIRESATTINFGPAPVGCPCCGK